MCYFLLKIYDKNLDKFSKNHNFPRWCDGWLSLDENIGPVEENDISHMSHHLGKLGSSWRKFIKNY